MDSAWIQLDLDKARTAEPPPGSQVQQELEELRQDLLEILMKEIQEEYRPTASPEDGR